jgi:hypothetical protein
MKAAVIFPSAAASYFSGQPWSSSATIAGWPWTASVFFHTGYRPPLRLLPVKAAMIFPAAS